MKKVLKPRARRYKRTRQAIVLTAQNIIARQGTDGLSMRSLAEETDYSPAGLYEYFDSKDEIIQAVRFEGLRRLQIHLQQAVTVHCPIDAIKTFGSLYTEFAQQNPVYFHLIFSYDLQTNGTKCAIDFDDLTRSLFTLIHKGVESKIFKPQQGLNQQAMVYAVWSLIHGFATFRVTKVGEVLPELASVERVLLHSLIGTFQ